MAIPNSMKSGYGAVERIEVGGDTFVVSAIDNFPIR